MGESCCHPARSLYGALILWCGHPFPYHPELCLGSPGEQEHIAMEQSAGVKRIESCGIHPEDPKVTNMKRLRTYC